MRVVLAALIASLPSTLSSPDFRQVAKQILDYSISGYCPVATKDYLVSLFGCYIFYDMLKVCPRRRMFLVWCLNVPGACESGESAITAKAKRCVKCGERVYSYVMLLGNTAPRNEIPEMNISVH